jgi:hypothetical protein
VVQSRFKRDGYHAHQDEWMSDVSGSSFRAKTASNSMEKAMNRTVNVLLRNAALGAAAIALSACVAPGYYGAGYSDGAYGAGGYDGCYGSYSPAYCGYPVYGGSVVIGGSSYRGLHYRDGRSGREFWHEGGWRRGNWDRGRGPGDRGRG